MNIIVAIIFYFTKLYFLIFISSPFFILFYFLFLF